MNGRADVIAYLRWLADQPDGLNHRGPLFRAALLLERDATTTVQGQSHIQALLESIGRSVRELRESTEASRRVMAEMERHGDQST